jgi:hypothetical protein
MRFFESQDCPILRTYSNPDLHRVGRNEINSRQCTSECTDLRIILYGNFLESDTGRLGVILDMPIAT